MSKAGLSDLELLGICSSEARAAFSAATARITAYWADECARDLDKLIAHFTGDAEVVTPEGTFRGREAVASLYRKSFHDFPGLKVDVKAGLSAETPTASRTVRCSPIR